MDNISQGFRSKKNSLMIKQLTIMLTLGSRVFLATPKPNDEYIKYVTDTMSTYIGEPVNYNAEYFDSDFNGYSIFIKSL